MSDAKSERRLLALVGGPTRVDVSAPIEATLGQALARARIALNPERHALVLHDGREVSLDSRVMDLDNGTLLSIVDLIGTEPDRARRLREQGSENYGPWILLGIVGVVVAAFVIESLTHGQRLLAGTPLAFAVISLGGGAALSAAVWARRRASTSFAQSLTMLPPLLLAFAAGAAAVPVLAKAPQLAVTCGLLSAASLAALVMVATRSRDMRAVAGATAALLSVLASIWGVTVWLGWDTAAAAAISIGIVAPGLRFLPSTLLNIPDGYMIDYKHFVSNRWTVRGSIPEDPGMIDMTQVRPYVTESSSRLAASTLILSGLAPVMTPFILPGLVASNTLVVVGTVGTLAMTALALMLMPRHSSTGTLRWIPRVAASLILAQLVVAVGLNAGPRATTLIAVLLLAAALVTLILVVYMARGSKSLGWSRVGDTVEWIAVALALPLAFLSADTLRFMRELMAG